MIANSWAWPDVRPGPFVRADDEVDSVILVALVASLAVAMSSPLPLLLRCVLGRVYVRSRFGGQAG